MKIQLLALLKVLAPYTIITICYAGNGHRLYEGGIDEVPEHLFKYFVTYVSLTNLNDLYQMYIEVHELDSFADN